MKTLDQSEQVKQAVEEVAEDLAAVNVALKDELTAGPTEAGVGNALYKTERIEKLKSMSRTEDTVSRRGGDEFLYLLTELRSEADAAAVATKVIHAVSEPVDVSTDNLVCYTTVTPSIGIAIFPQDGATAEALIARADEAMYRAKRSGLGSSFAR